VIIKAFVSPEDLRWGRPGGRKGRMVRGRSERLLVAGLGTAALVMGVFIALHASGMWPFVAIHLR
jgi:hypothetical protein